MARLHGPTQPLLAHLVRRTADTLRQAQTLPEDYHLELRDAANAVLAGLWQSGAAPLAREAGLPERW